jgi:ElaB/YqjD/DUF883 family membrane-anchored ribosome-binding protein
MAQSGAYGDREPSTLKERATEGFERAAGEAAERYGQMADRAQGESGRIAEHGRNAGERMQEVAGNIKGAIDKSVKEQPMATVALTAVAGFILGALWRR